MQIDKNSWHARLYLRAYVEDREWANSDIRPKEAPNMEPLRALRYERNSKMMNWKEVTAWQKRYDAALADYDAAYDQLVIEAKVEHRKTVKEQFLSGRLSLCPYFWKVVSAMLIYTCLVRPVQWFSRLMKRFTNWIARPVIIATAVVASLLAMYGLGKLGLYAIEEAPRFLAERQANQAKAQALEAKEKAEEARLKQVYAEQRQLQEWVEQQRQAATLKWQTNHAEEIRREREMEARMAAAQEAETDAKEAAEFMKDLPAYFKLGFNFLILIMIFVTSIVWIFPALGRGLVTLLETPWLILALIIIKLEKTPSGKTFLQRVDKWMIRREKRRAARKKAWRETIELISAMLKATKERVCPFLNVVDGSHGETAKQ